MFHKNAVSLFSHKRLVDHVELKKNIRTQQKVLIRLFSTLVAAFSFFSESFPDVSKNDQVHHQDGGDGGPDLVEGSLQFKVIDQNLFGTEESSDRESKH